MTHPPPAAAGNHRPICTICYEDLKPIAEDLQVVPICGHVFHELCLQQWLEYCPAGKRPTCPFCKQSCAHDHPTRLYFQSIGDPTQLSSQTPFSEADAEALADEVKRLEAKISSFASTFENQQAHLKKLNDELSEWKESSKRAEVKKDEIKKEKDRADQILRMKMEELSRKSSECSKLEERSLGLAKELAALKLATDLNLGEEEMVKLASLGHSGNPENAVHVLRKSLALRNKSYKELMGQCNLLGRSEARTRLKLDKTNEKMRKLKMRLQELEKILEEKENGVLRDLKVSNKMNGEDMNLDFVEKTFNFQHNGKCSLECQAGKPVEVLPNSNQINLTPDWPHHSKTNFDAFTTSLHKENDRVINLEKDSCFLIDEDVLELTPESYKPSTSASAFYNSEFYKNAQFNSAQASSPQNNIRAGGSWSSGIITENVEKASTKLTIDKDTCIDPTFTTEEVLNNSISKQIPSIAVRKEGLHGSVAYSGDPCFPGGLLGVEGSNKTVGRWCRQTNAKASSLLNQASANNGDLIAVGADGRGGKVKVLRAHDRFSDAKAQTSWPKKQKCGAKQSGQSQIENFFGRAKS